MNDDYLSGYCTFKQTDVEWVFDPRIGYFCTQQHQICDNRACYLNEKEIIKTVLVREGGNFEPVLTIDDKVEKKQ